MVARSPRAEEREKALRALATRMRESRERRIRTVMAQSGEPLGRTLLRVAYLTACVLVDGVVLLELVRAVPGALGWALYLLALAVAVPLQVRLYRRHLDVSRDHGARA